MEGSTTMQMQMFMVEKFPHEWEQFQINWWLTLECENVDVSCVRVLFNDYVHLCGWIKSNVVGMYKSTYKRQYY